MLHWIKNIFLNLRLRKALAEHAKFPGETEKLRLARLYLELSLLDDARAIIQDGLATFPGSRRLREARDEIRRARAVVMLDEIEQVVLENEPSAEDFIRASDLARVAGDMERAFSYAHEGMVAFPEDWEVHLALGKLHFHRYNSTREAVDGVECLKHLDKARRIAPEEPKVLFFLAMGHAVQGEQREALAVVELLTARYPDYPKASTLRRRIRDAISAEAAAKGDETLEGTASRLHAALAPLGLDAAAVREQFARIEGVTGWFFIDEEGEVIASHVADDPLFDLSDPGAGLEALAASCRFGSGRIGIGDLQSLSLSGEGWGIHLRALGDLSFVTFSKGMSSSAVEDLVSRIVKAVPVACEA